jgi:hypothetical protein
LLNEVQKQRVREALQFDPDKGDVVTLVEKLQGSEELLQFVLNYDPNDGLAPLWTIIRSEHCDAGTALLVYWLNDEFALNRHGLGRKPDMNWDGVGLIEEIEQRYLTGFYRARNIRFDPLEFMGWSYVKVRLLIHINGGKLPFPEQMLPASLGQPLLAELI